MISSAFTIIAPVDPARTDDLQDLLDHIEADPRDNDVWSPADVEGVHYACGAIIPCALGGQQFLLELNGDGPEAEIVDRAVATSGAGLTLLFSCCIDGPTRSGPALAAYLHRHTVRAGASHVGNVGRTIAQIRDEERGAATVRRAIDDARATGTLPAAPDRVADVARNAWSPSRSPRRRTRAERLRFIARLIVVVAVVVVAAVALAPLTLASVCWLRLKERRDPVHTSPADPDRLRQLTEQDDQLESVQNHLISLVPIKPGPFRLVLLRLVLLALDSLARVAFDRGKLGSIDSIHFAHWSIIDDGRSLLFVSNFDGSWESYLGDFIEKAHGGLTAVWGNCLGFPRARWLVLDGATDGPLFKNYARCSQHQEAFWFQAYPARSVRAIDEASALRDSLATRAPLPAWLAPTPSSVQGRTPSPEFPAAAWDTDSVQTLVLSGHGRLPASCFVHLLLPDSIEDAKRWLRDVLPEVATGPSRPEDAALQLAFTASGLRRLGVPEPVVDSFGGEFLDGLGTTHRSRILGDLGASDPSTWAWGGPDRPIDVVAMVYAPDEAQARVDAERVTQALIDAGGRLACAPLDARLPADGKEHFGFTDGISQPVLAATDEDADRWSLVDPGEVVLGLRDGSDGPVTPAPGGPGWEELGHLGSFVVMRQLAQDVAGFWSTMRSQAGDGAAAEHLAERVVGRRRDGTPLAPSEAPADGRPGNDFGYALEDPHGLACPVGSHIRRANPRDTGEERPGRALANNNRHRLLRRGRLYGPSATDEADDADRGLVFVCLVADLARQFEFVQHHWLNGRTFDVIGEVDPLTGSQVAGNGDFSWAAQPVLGRVVDLPDFVRTRGGVYAFLPSRPALARLTRADGDRSGPEHN